MGNPVRTESYVPWSKGPRLDQIPSGPSGGWLSIHFRDWYTHWMVNDHVLTLAHINTYVYIEIYTHLHVHIRYSMTYIATYKRTDIIICIHQMRS